MLVTEVGIVTFSIGLVYVIVPSYNLSILFFNRIN